MPMTRTSGSSDEAPSRAAPIAAKDHIAFALPFRSKLFHFRAQSHLVGCKRERGPHTGARRSRSLINGLQMGQSADDEDRKAILRGCLDRLKSELQVLDGFDCGLAAVYLATACEVLEADISDELSVEQP